MWVIKLGGSVTCQSSLVQWLQRVARWGDGKVIIVPGGGLYADAVRHFQQMRSELEDGHLSDKHAHALAIYAMDQMARSLVAIEPALTLVRNPLEIAERGWQHRGLVWLPSEMGLHPERWGEDLLPENWETTSDSLAAWLAVQLEACHLVLVKSDARVREAAVSHSLTSLCEAGIVDPAMRSILPASGLCSWVVHESQYGVFDTGFDVTRLQGHLIMDQVESVLPHAG